MRVMNGKVSKQETKTCSKGQQTQEMRANNVEFRFKANSQAPEGTHSCQFELRVCGNQ
jgi:hypothetical protein